MDQNIATQEEPARPLTWDFTQRRLPVRILLAEADPEVRAGLAHRLGALGFDVVEVEDGREMLEEFSDWEPDLIIAGLELPRVDGLDALAQLRRLNHVTPYILISPGADPDVHARAARLGAAFVYTRPFDVKHLVGSIWSIVGA